MAAKKFGQGFSPNVINKSIRENKPKPEKPDPKKYDAECLDCKSIFFGFTQKEADARRAKHKCSKKK